MQSLGSKNCNCKRKKTHSTVRFIRCLCYISQHKWQEIKYSDLWHLLKHFRRSADAVGAFEDVCAVYHILYLSGQLPKISTVTITVSDEVLSPLDICSHNAQRQKMAELAVKLCFPLSCFYCTQCCLVTWESPH